MLPQRSCIRLSKNALHKFSAPQYPLVKRLGRSALSLRSDFGPSPSRADQTAADQLGAPPKPYTLFNKSPVRFPGLRFAAAKLRQYAVTILPLVA